MSEAFERQTLSFILRLWNEPSNDPSASRWRGQIEQVGSGATASFQIPEGFLDFLRVHLPSTGKVAPDESEKLKDQ